MIKAQQQKNNKDKFFQKYVKGTLHSHSAIASFGSPNSGYEATAFGFCPNPRCARTSHIRGTLSAIAEVINK